MSLAKYRNYLRLVTVVLYVLTESCSIYPVLILKSRASFYIKIAYSYTGYRRYTLPQSLGVYRLL